MDEQTRSLHLQQQQAQSTHGTITYESGLELATITGLLYGLNGGFVVFGDPCALIVEQQRTYVPANRVVRVDFDA